MNKWLIAAVSVVGLGAAYYFLFNYNYNEAKDAMSIVMPDYMLVYAQESMNITKLWQDAGLIRLFNTNMTGLTVISNQLDWPAAVIYQDDNMVVIYNGVVTYDSANRFWHAVDIVRDQGGYEIREVIPVVSEYGTGYNVILVK